MPERGLRQRIRAALRRAFPGALVLGWPSNLWTGPGWPDLLFSEWPLLVGFEVKQGRRSKPTALQASRHVELRKHHVPVYVTYDPDDAVHIITTLKEKLPMAFDPALLAELEAALSDTPLVEPAPEPEPVISLAADRPLTDAEMADAQAAFQAGMEAAAVDASTPATPAPRKRRQRTAAPAYPEAEAENGTVMIELDAPPFRTLDADAPAPDIADLTAAIVANEEIARADVEEALEIERTLLGVLLALKDSIDALSINVVSLLDELRSDDEAPAPRRRTRRS